jgi:predicted GNAT family acetyltransferase
MNDPTSHPKDEALLDNPIWSSLTTHHAHLALGADTGHGLARRYPFDIGPLSALLEPTPQAYADLADLVTEGDAVALFLKEAPQVPPGWKVVLSATIVQMICRAAPAPSPFAETIIPLQSEDIPEMVALTALTEPGPFRDRTATLGGFLGIRVDGRLAAMAGQRLSPTGFTEISAVCTHPDHRGRGYAQALVTAVARDIHAEGRTPFLTALESNTGAIRVYQQVGFVLRRTFQLSILKPPPASKPTATISKA